MLLGEIRDDFLEDLHWTLENIILNKFLSPVNLQAINKN